MAITSHLHPLEHPVDVYRDDPVTPLENKTPQQVYSREKTLFRTYQVIWYILGVVEVLLAFRLVLRALGANPTSGFVELVYALSGPLALPFRGVVPATGIGGGLAVIEWSTMIAMVVYLIVAYGLVKLFQMAKPTDPIEVERALEQ